MESDPQPRDLDIVRELATAVMGYEPDSVDDLQNRLDAATNGQRLAMRKIAEATANAEYWTGQIAMLNTLLVQKGKTQP